MFHLCLISACLHFINYETFKQNSVSENPIKSRLLSLLGTRNIT